MKIPNCEPEIAGNELKYLTECIDSRWLSPVGPFVSRFEEEFARLHNVETAAAVSSGTAAIHLGLIALGVKAGDMVICPVMTFSGSVNPIIYCGALPIFIDVDENTLNIDPVRLSEFLAAHTKFNGEVLLHAATGRRISAMIVVHLYGNPADMDALMKSAAEYKLPVLEDAAESLGARYGGRRVGTIGDVGCFSFNGNKLITTGGGGMIISRDSEKTKLCKHLSTQARSDPFEYFHDAIGYNYRLSNLCAAVGVAQMEHLDEFIQKKRRNAALYKKLLRDDLWQVIEEPANCLGTYWMVLCRLRDGGGSILERIRQWSKDGLGVRPVWYPLNMLEIYKDAPYLGDGRCRRLYNTTFCLPSSVGLTGEQITYAARTLNAYED